MIAASIRDRRAERRAATRAEILEAAWALARSQGVAALSLGDVARRIGVRPPSLYWYFPSKTAIYDAMFAEGNRQLLQRIAERDWPEDLRELLRAAARFFVQFCVEDLARYQLMFQRTIPDFEPSPESFALAMGVLEQMRGRFAAAGITDPADLDMWTALVGGLSAQQTSNDPGGDRWLRLTDPVADMFAEHLMAKKSQKQSQEGRSRR